LNQVHVNWVYSIRTAQVYINLCVGFVVWAKRRYGIRFLTQIDMAVMATRYLREEFIDRKRSAYTIKTVYASLAKLPVAVRQKWGYNIGTIDREALGPMPARRLADRKWAGAYEEAQFTAIVEWMRSKRSPKAKLAAVVVELQRHCGLRVSEAVGLRARMVNQGAGALVITETTITKGGRDRLEALRVPPELMARLVPLVAAAHGADGPILHQVTADYVRKLVRTACDQLNIPRHGTHGFRHQYAQQRYAELISAGVGHDEAMRQVAEDLGHSRPGITRTYVRE
jgi:integrase